MTQFSRTLSKAEGARVLRRAGYSVELVQEIYEQLPDPIDLDRDAPVLTRYGITRDQLISVMGGSP